MKSKNQKPLTDHIREVLQDHEEPYVLGSWERFQRYKVRKSKIRHRRYTVLSVAASVLLILSFLFAWNRADIMQEQYLAEQQVELPPVPGPQTLHPSDEEDEQLTIEGEMDSSAETGSRQVVFDGRFTTGSLHDDLLPERYEAELMPSIARRSILYQVFTESGIETTPGTSEDHQHPTNQRRSDWIRNLQAGHLQSQVLTDPPLVQNTDIQRTAQTGKKEVEFSLAYAPLMNVYDSQTDWGIGGGFFTDWNFSNNMALSSGLFIAQNQLKYRNDQGSLARTWENNTLTSMPGNLASMQVDLVSLEIPLSFRYYLTDQFSVSAGISSVAYLKENFDYTYEYQQQIQVFETGDTAGPQPMTTRIVTLTESHTETEPSLTGMDLAAFYTFTIGYQYNIAERQKISVEPFLKLPTGQLTSRDIQYTTGGLQLKIHF